MPHFTLHYSDNMPDFDAERCLMAVNTALAASSHFVEVDIKSRAFRAETYLVGTQREGRAFVAGQLALFDGRDEAVKKTLGAVALEAIRSCVADTSPLHIQLSVEVVELQRSVYAKAVLPGASGQ